MVHPNAKKKVKWDLLVAVLIAYSTVSVPFRIGFEETAGVFGTVVDIVVDVVFALDIVTSFRTAYVDEVRPLFLLRLGTNRLGGRQGSGRWPYVH